MKMKPKNIHHMNILMKDESRMISHTKINFLLPKKLLPITQKNFSPIIEIVSNNLFLSKIIIVTYL